MTLATMNTRGLAFGYKALGEPARLTAPGAGSHSDVTVIYSVDGAAVLDGMAQSIGPSLRLRKSEAPTGVLRGTLFELPESGVIWKASEDGQEINDGAELQVTLGRVGS